MNEEQLYLAKLLSEAVHRVYVEERFLLQYAQGDRTGLEQAFVFRVGLYLSDILKGTAYENLDLDSEYNKNHGGAKTSRRFPHGLRPDLMIHMRDSNEENKLVAEFKGYWENDIADDITKLEDLTDPHDNYHYVLGVFVNIGRVAATNRYFIDGNEI